jgi:hypothetical protein
VWRTLPLYRQITSDQTAETEGSELDDPAASPITEPRWDGLRREDQRKTAQ